MGDRRETWAKGTTLWPESLLPAKVPQSRILTFGYDADIYHFWSPASDNTIKNHADSLIAGLVAFRYDKKETVERPIIFVAHSLGGLVCAKLGRCPKSQGMSNQDKSGSIDGGRQPTI